MVESGYNENNKFVDDIIRLEHQRYHSTTNSVRACAGVCVCEREGVCGWIVCWCARASFLVPLVHFEIVYMFLYLRERAYVW